MLWVRVPTTFATVALRIATIAQLAEQLLLSRRLRVQVPAWLHSPVCCVCASVSNFGRRSTFAQRISAWPSDGQTRRKSFIKLWNDGLTGTQIACKVGGVSRNAVLGLVHRKASWVAAIKATNSDKSTASGTTPGASGRQARQRYQMRHQPTPKKPKPVSAVKQLLRDLPTEPLPSVDPMTPTVCHNKLEHHHCRAPVENTSTLTRPYCGRQRMEGVSYCEHHARRYFAPPSVAKPYINESSRCRASAHQNRSVQARARQRVHRSLKRLQDRSGKSSPVDRVRRAYLASIGAADHDRSISRPASRTQHVKRFIQAKAHHRSTTPISVTPGSPPNSASPSPFVRRFRRVRFPASRSESAMSRWFRIYDDVLDDPKVSGCLATSSRRG